MVLISNFNNPKSLQDKERIVQARLYPRSNAQVFVRPKGVSVRARWRDAAAATAPDFFRKVDTRIRNPRGQRVSGPLQIVKSTRTLALLQRAGGSRKRLRRPNLSSEGEVGGGGERMSKALRKSLRCAFSKFNLAPTKSGM